MIAKTRKCYAESTRELSNEIRRVFNADADDILDYFKDTYIGRPR